MAQTPSDASTQGPGGADEGKRVTEGSAELAQDTRNTLHVLEAGSSQLRPSQSRWTLGYNRAEGAAHGIHCTLKIGRTRLESQL